MTNKKVQFTPVSPQIETIVREHGGQPRALLEILTALLVEKGTLTRGMLEDVARLLNLPPAQVYGVATFYSMLDVTEDIHSSPISTIRVCDGPVCWLCGSGIPSPLIGTATYPGVKLERTSCLGLCDRAPAALIDGEQVGPLDKIIVSELLPGFHGEDIDYSVARAGEVRIMLEQVGKIDPDSIESALATGAYSGLESALSRSPQDVITEVENSRLTGRGGAGFPVGRKWRFVATAALSPKFVVCNADESEPLIFKDRVLIDTNPHQVLEGMAIAGFATGARRGYIYIRGEYVRQAERLERAVAQAEKAGWLGDKINGSDFSFHVYIHRGAGAYICGEETALLESLEGKRGEPRLRPPYPPTNGFQNLPTLVNNVESFSAIPSILRRGAEWYRSLSDNSAGGTKLYILLGHVNRPGLFEAPFGLTLRQLIFDFGGGMRSGSNFHFALCGGAAGTIVGENLLDTPIDYASAAKGISLGAGAFLVCDERVSPVALLRELLHFFKVESCGKCTPCRIGTARIYALVARLAEGNAQLEDLEQLAQLASMMQLTSFCGLGQSVYIPVMSALGNFEKDFASGLRS